MTYFNISYNKRVPELIINSYTKLNKTVIPKTNSITVIRINSNYPDEILNVI